MIRRLPCAVGLVLLCLACPGALPAASADADDLLIVDCLLPGQVRQLGQRITYVSARRPTRTTASECRIRGGEYVLQDRASAGTALRVWMAEAEAGNPEAMTMVGEIFERGFGVPPDYAGAASWYRRAATFGFVRAQVNLGHLYEIGLGVERNGRIALEWYRRAAGVGGSLGLEPAAAGQQENAGSLDRSLLAGPDITIIEPVVATRGLVKVEAPPRGDSRQIIGRVSAPAGLLSLAVNGEPTHLNRAGIFQVTLAAPEQDSSVLITAIDQQGQRAEVEIAFAGRASRDGSAASQRAVTQGVDFGAYHALLIGNERYSTLPDLKTPIADVDRLRDVLERDYGFTTTVLRNSTRYEILSALNRLRERLTTADNLIVYYAGHGELDEANDRGHWLPIEAEPQNTANWISNVAVTDLLNAIRAKQILLIVDSCYSGTLTRSSIARLRFGMTPEERRNWLRVMSKKRARLVLTSGGVAPVMDSGGGVHSVFARALIETLEANQELLSARSLYQAVTARVALAAAGYEFEQVPEFAPIRRAGHEAGGFFLVPQAWQDTR